MGSIKWNVISFSVTGNKIVLIKTVSSENLSSETTGDFWGGYLKDVLKGFTIVYGTQSVFESIVLLLR